MADSSPVRSGGALRRLHLLIRSNWISTLGAATATLALLALVTILALSMRGDWGGPYVGLLTVIVLPALFLAGVLLIPFGLLIYRGKLEERLAKLSDKPMSMARAVAALTIVNFAAVGTLGYGGAAYMSSVQFCGTACHSAMQPEYDTFVDSPHSRVACVECHVGPGAESYVKSKINGSLQLWHFLKDDYERPVPTPVHNLRSARETCENCHWPEKYLGTKLLVRPHFREDDAVTQYVNVVLMRTGGKRMDGQVVGIHWHTHPDATVEYVATDKKRTQIPWVRVKKPDGTTDVFTAPGIDAQHAPAGEQRTMDCNDCHNRSAHSFDAPGPALDRAIAGGLIDKQLPGIKRHALEALRFDWTRQNAGEGIRQHLQKVYASQGGLDEAKRQALEPAIATVTKIWMRNIYPERGVRWDTYEDFNSHAGCFRCHDGKHRNAAGKAITHDCKDCHVVLSEEQEDPAILDTFGMRGK